ncbi:MAG: hypothetical protein ACFCUX_08605 [Candidatus Methylacidiphilales bacterium]
MKHLPDPGQWLAWGACALIMACAGSPSGQPITTPNMSAVVISEPSTVLLMDDQLAVWLAVEDQEITTTGDGVRLARTVFKNLSDENRLLEARCLFKDSAGKTLEVSPWKAVTLNSKSRTTHVAPTLQRAAVRFIVQIRPIL